MYERTYKEKYTYKEVQKNHYATDGLRQPQRSDAVGVKKCCYRQKMICGNTYLGLPFVALPQSQRQHLCNPKETSVQVLSQVLKLQKGWSHKNLHPGFTESPLKSVAQVHEILLCGPHALIYGNTFTIQYIISQLWKHLTSNTTTLYYSYGNIT